MTEKPMGAYLPQLCQRLQTVGGGSGWQARIVSALVGSGNIAPQKMIDDLHPNEIFACVGNTTFQPGQNITRELHHIVLVCLYSMGFIKMRPQVVTHVTEPEMNMDDVLDAMITSDIKLPVRTDLKGDRPRWGTFCAALPDYIKEIAYVLRLRDHYRDMLREWACHVGYKLTLQRSILDAEKTLYLHVASGAPRAYTADELANGYAACAAMPPLRAALSSSKHAEDAFARYCASVGAGPYSKYMSFASELDGTNLSYYWGPAPASLVVSTGYGDAIGEFRAFELQPMMQIEWSAQSQMAAIAERQAQILSGPVDPFVIQPPVQSATAAGSPPFTSVDELDFKISLRSDVANMQAPLLSNFDVEYECRLTQRRQSTAAGTFQGAAMLLYDKGFSKESFGGGTAGEGDVAKFPLLDLSLSDGINIVLLQDVADHIGMALVNVSSWDERIYWPDPRHHLVMWRNVGDLKHLYFKKGPVMVVPARREHVLAPRSWLFTPREDAEDMIIGLLGLNQQERHLAQESVRVSHNMALLSTLLPEGNLPSFSIPLFVRAHI
jgi:hypothetical protein